MQVSGKKKNTPVPPKAAARFVSAANQLTSKLDAIGKKVKRGTPLKTKEMDVLKRQIQMVLTNAPASW
jgi:hypothetical protein